MDFTTGKEYARHEEGLNDFRYCASLHIEHPSMPSSAVSEGLEMTPDRCHEKGDPRKTPKGQALTGVYPSTFWCTTLKLKDGLSLDEFLHSLAIHLQPRRDVLRTIHATGGRIECFVGIHATRLCDTCFPCELLSHLADFRIDLRLDFYGPKNSQPTEESTKTTPS